MDILITENDLLIENGTMKRNQRLYHSRATSLNAKTPHEIYNSIYITESKHVYSCFEYTEFCI